MSLKDGKPARVGVVDGQRTGSRPGSGWSMGKSYFYTKDNIIVKYDLKFKKKFKPPGGEPARDGVVDG